MSVPLIDWLYTNDLKDLSKGALVIFPRMVDRWNVASLIVSKWARYKIVVVTDHAEEFMETIFKSDPLLKDSNYLPIGIVDSSFSNWTDQELVPFPILSYSKFDDINRALINTEIDVVLFDDARMLSTISPAINVPINPQDDPKIIVLTTWGDTMKQLELVTLKFPHLKLLVIDLISDISNIDWKVSRVPMSNKQLHYYNQIRAREITDTSLHNISYPLTRMITLYTYPDIIMKETLSHNLICETDQSTIPDKLDSPGWINKSYIPSLYNDGPKLLSVIDGIIAHWPLKQLVITRYNHRYGVDLITSFLRLMSMNKQNPYELDEIFHISCTDEYESTLNTFHKFNESKSAILISNIIPLVPLKEVSIIHIADTYSFENIKTVLDRCHKRYLNTTGKDLIIYSHIATNPNMSAEKSSDDVLHERLQFNITESNRIYTGLISMAQHIVFNPTTGLVVI